MSAASVLAPLSEAAYKNGHREFYGAVEVDVATGEEIWRFDAPASKLEVGQYWQDGEVVRQTGFRPASVQRLADGRTLLADWDRGVIVDAAGNVHRTFSHELFNDVHEIQRLADGGYLIAATGLDSLVVLDDDLEERWRWHMWEHVDPTTRPGDYYPDQLWYQDVRTLALSPDDRYHLNYATVLDGQPTMGEGTLLCSALNYGVFTVDIATGAVGHAYTDLDECHNPYPLDDRVVVAESGADRVVAVDWEGGCETLFGAGIEFVKDADPVGDPDPAGGDWVLADTKHDRVVIWTIGADEPTHAFPLGEDANPYEADYLTGDRSFA